MTKKLVIVGDGEFAEIACEYFTQDSPYEVVAFAVESQYRKRDALFDRPVVDFETLHERFPPSDADVFVAVSYVQLNRVRARLFRDAKQRGYTAASYVSSRAFVWHNVTVGENSFIFEGNTLQYHARVGDDVILWSGNHIGHRSVIGDHCYLSSHVVVSGYCDIGRSCFLGVNSTIGDRVRIADDCVIGAGAVVLKNTEPQKVYRGNPATAAGPSSLSVFNVKQNAG